MRFPSGDITRPWRQALPKVGLAIILLGVSLVLAFAMVQAEGTGAIAGRVTYVGGVPGQHPVQVCWFPRSPDSPCVTPNEGAYVLDGLADGDYTVQALVNVHSESSTDWSDAIEAWYDPDGDGEPDTVSVAGGLVTGIDISVGGPWIPLGGPVMEGGQVLALGVDGDDPDVVYAAVKEPYNADAVGQVFKSTDGGASWTIVYTPSAPVYDVVARDGRVCLARAHDQASELTCSDDAGVTWSDLGAIAPGYIVQALDLAISSEDSSTLLLAGRVVTITDGSDIEELDQTYGLPAVLSGTIGGGSWQRVMERPSNEGERTAFHAIAEDPFMAGRFFVGGDDAWVDGLYPNDSGCAAGTIYRIEGGDWENATPVYAGEECGWVLSLAVDPKEDGVILASTLSSVLRSANGGDTWEEVPDQEGGEYLAFSPAGGAYLATPNGTVYASHDDGDTWQAVTPVGGYIDTFAAGADLYVGGRTDGVLRSTDGGDTWAPSNEGITFPITPRSLAVDPFDSDHLLAAADRSGGWRSDDGGDTWSLDLDGSVGVHAFHPREEGVVYRGLSSTAHGALERSADGGASWEIVYTSTMHHDGDSFEAAILAVAPAPSRPSTVYAGGYDNPSAPNATDRQAVIVRSTGDGVAGSWVERRRLPEGSWIEALTVHPANPDVAYAGGTWRPEVYYEGFLRRTMDGGETWPTVFTDTHPIKTIAIDPEDPRVIYVGTSGYQVHRSDDGGDSWTLVPDGSGDLVVADPRAPGRVYLAGPNTVLESVDYGETWLEQPNALAPAPQAAPRSLTVVNDGDRQTFYLGAEGLWTFTRSAPPGVSRLYVPTVISATP